MLTIIAGIGAISILFIFLSAVAETSLDNKSLFRSNAKTVSYKLERNIIEENYGKYCSMMNDFQDKSHYSLNHPHWHGLSKMLDRVK